ncbi:MAG TPA: FHA domain-containing protein [Gemmataceae bacterium]|nr:FHA domain-containing protein [Gemmataceae bacterium]
MELFLQACGRKGPLRLQIESPGQSLTTQRILHQPFALIGCDPRMDLFLSHPQIARRHAYLQVLDGKIYCIDLQGQTEVRGDREASPNICFGPFSLRAVDEISGDPLHVAEFSAPQPPGEDDLPEVALEFVNRLPGPTVWRMGTRIALVGKASVCRVRLVGDSVSKFHCSLVRTPLGLWVVDLFGKAGITVNEAPVRSARLKDGDRLQVGNFIIRPRYLQPAPVRAPLDDLGTLAQQMIQQSSSSISLPSFRDSFTETATHDLEQTTTSPASPSAAAPSDGLPIASILPPLLPTASISGASVPANSELVQSLLVPIAQQLGTIQQQMFEQFQQAMLMMFQMFGRLQREQIGVIRDEMDRLHQLSREVLALQSELAKRPQPTAERPRTAPASASGRTVPESATVSPTSRPAPAPKPAPESKPLPQPEGQPEKDMHAWLSQRLAALQEERQTRWQKIVSFLSGKAREKSTP